MLLNPRGEHGQGERFLRIFVEQLGLGDVEALHLEKALVRREAATHGISRFRRRMDILVEAGISIVIENKVDSLEQPGQVKDYLEHLAFCARDSEKRRKLVYLTPDGRMPLSLTSEEIEHHKRSNWFVCWSYKVELRRWLESCIRLCEAEKIRAFLRNFIEYIDTTIAVTLLEGLENDE
jgi:hypothetical protein